MQAAFVPVITATSAGRVNQLSLDLMPIRKPLKYKGTLQEVRFRGRSQMSFTDIHPDFRLPDEVWQQVQRAILPEPPKPKGGRPRMDNRQALDAIFYVLRTGCHWKALPRSLGAASTVHDRFQLWVKQGVFERMWELGLEQYAQEVGIEWEWMAMDGAMVKAPLGGKSNRS